MTKQAKMKREPLDFTDINVTPRKVYSYFRPEEHVGSIVACVGNDTVVRESQYAESGYDETILVDLVFVFNDRKIDECDVMCFKETYLSRVNQRMQLSDTEIVVGEVIEGEQSGNAKPFVFGPLKPKLETAVCDWLTRNVVKVNGHYVRVKEIDEIEAAEIELPKKKKGSDVDF